MSQDYEIQEDKMIDKRQYIESTFHRRVGHPVLRVESEGTDLDSAILNSCHKYYQANPISKVRISPVSQGINGVSVSEIQSSLFGDASDTRLLSRSR